MAQALALQAVEAETADTAIAMVIGVMMLVVTRRSLSLSDQSLADAA